MNIRYASPKRIIRPMTENDIHAVTEIEEASFQTPWKPEHFRQELNLTYSYPFVFESDGAVIGFICLMSIFEEAQILDIAVATNQRNFGVAQQLIEYAEKFAKGKGAEYIVLEVRISNRPAINLYKKLGYIETGVRSLYYDQKEDAVLMRKIFEKS